MDLPGIGPARRAALAQVGIHTRLQALWHAPRDLGPPPPLADSGPWPTGALRVRARVVKVTSRFGRGLTCRVYLERADGTPLQAWFFNARWLAKQITVGQWHLWEGAQAQPGILQHPAFTAIPGPEADPGDPGCRTAYALPDGVPESVWRKAIATALAEPVEDPAREVSAAEVAHHLRLAHLPATSADHEQGRRFLAWRTALALAARAREHLPGRAVAWPEGLAARLPFALTAGQADAVAAIRLDLASGFAMRRLLAGEVGSGKTVLAAAAAAAVIAAGRSVLWLAPTAVLVAQHAAVSAWTGCAIATWTAATTTKEREGIQAAVAAGPVLVIGTQALGAAELGPADLGLVIVDEGHRLGASEQERLLAKGRNPHLLLTTATPIPRTLALSWCAELAISTIAGPLPGRSPVTTAVQPSAGRAALMNLLSPVLGRGRTAFLVCPRRSAGDHSAESLTRWADTLWPGRVELVHGGRDDAEITAAVARIRSGDADLLVATTVVEVGIDLPRADMMVVVGAERLGLAQLHQLRGRVGRGGHPGACVFLHDGDGERIRPLETLHDGLAVAELDCRLRGPGDLLGHRQHGSGMIASLDPLRDLDLLERARQVERIPAAVTGILAQH